MGKYNGAVITTAGQNIIAESISGTLLEWTVMRSSSVAIPAGTNLEALTSLTGIEQSTHITDASVYGNNVLQVSARFSNTGVSTAYLIQTVGIYGQLTGGSETLIAVMTAVTPDEMPVYDPDSPSAFIYNTQVTVQNADSVTMVVNDTGTATVADLNRKVNVSGGDVSDTVVNTVVTESAEYPVPAAGDTLKVILGKLIKFFNDIRKVNSKTDDGLVPAPGSSNYWCFWSTNGNGDPGWRQGPVFQQATTNSDGYVGLVPAPAQAYNSDKSLMYLRSNATWAYLPLQNNGTTTAEHYALDARMGKTLNDKIDSLFIVKSYSFAYTITGNANLGIKANEFGVSTPTGYTPIAVSVFNSGNSYVVVASINIGATGSSTMMTVHNTSASTLTPSATLNILYVRTSSIT